MTSFENKCKIIAHLWVEQEEEMSEIWQDYDLSTPIAFAIYHGFVLDISEKAEVEIEKLFATILDYQGLEDTGFTDWKQLVGD